MMSCSDIVGIKPDYWDEAVAHLMRRDRILKKIIPQCEGKTLASPCLPFETLVRAILGQQVSTKSAGSLWQRFLEAVGQPPTPAHILSLGVKGLKEAGLPQRKSEYIQDLALHFDDCRVHPDQWTAMDDESVIAELIAIRGIGRWTAEMFLIFHLQRPDVLPLDDLGLLKAISLHYFSGEPVSRFEAREVSSAWQPWRTVATWYLWRSLEPTSVLN